MFITKEYLKKLGACVEAQEWFESTYPDGCKLSVEALTTVPNDRWVWWFGCRLYPDLVWVAVNIAFREAAKVAPELQSWVGKVNDTNCRQARSAAAAAAYAAAYAAADAAAAAAAYADAAAADAAAYAAADAAAAAAAYAAADAAAADAAAADAAAAVRNELNQAVVDALLK